MRKLSSVSISCLLITLALAISVSAQQPFNRVEFEARRAKLFEKMPDGVAVVFAAKNQFYPVKFRQAPDFYYLKGVEEPGAVLVMVGQNKSTILFVHRRSEPQVRAEGPGIWQVEKKEEVYGLTRVQPIEEFLPMLQFLGNARRSSTCSWVRKGMFRMRAKSSTSTRRSRCRNQSLAALPNRRRRSVWSSRCS